MGLRGSKQKRLKVEPLEHRLMLNVGPLVISEFLAINDEGLTDADGARSDWIEIHNPTDEPVSLDGWHLTDEADDLTKWEFPSGSGSLGPDEYLVVFASNKNRRVPGGELHTNFKLNGDGEYLALVRPDGQTIGMEYAPAFPVQFADVSYGPTQNSTVYINADSNLTYLVPTAGDAAIEGEWMAPDFDTSEWVGRVETPPVLFTEISTQTRDSAEIQNLSGHPVDTSGWVAAANDGSEGLNVIHPTLWNLPDTVDTDQILYRDDDSDGEFYWGENIMWSTKGDGWVMLLDDRGNVADFVVWGYTPAEFAAFQVTVNGHEITAADIWGGDPVPANHERSYTLQRHGGLDHNTAVDWAFADGDSPGGQNADLTIPFPEGKTLGIGFDVANTGLGDLIQSDLTVDMRGVNSSLWTRIPFEVLDELTPATLQLRLKYDDGFVAYLNGQEVARRNAPETPAWNSTATVAQPPAAATMFEAIDLSEYLHLLQPGENILAIHGLNVAVDDDTLLILPELKGRAAEEVLRYMDQPTPGDDNLATQVAAMPELSQPGGTFVDPFYLTMSLEASNGTIRYTIDGSVPTEDSTAYVTPILVDGSMQVRARVFEPGLDPGPIVGEAYIHLASNVRDFDSDIPILIVESFGGGTPNQNTLRDFHLTVFEPQDESGRTALTDSAEVSTRMGLKIRGSSSAGFAKKQYRIETRNQADDDFAYSLLGMPAESDWVLNGPYTDKSLIRNSLAFDLGNALGLKASRVRHCEVFLNTNGGSIDESDYVGVYILVESVKRGENRIDIPVLDPTDTTEPDITGGYIVRFEAGVAQAPAKLSGWNHLELFRHDTYTPQQKTWISNYVNEFDAVLKSDNFKDPVEGYAKYIDVDSFVNILVMNELVREQDSYSRSSYMWKDRGGKLTRGPLWDYNLSFGTGGYHNNLSRTGWQFAVSNTKNERRWNDRLMEDPDFWQKFVDRWHEVRQDVYNLDSILARVDAHADPIREAAARNFERWPVLNQNIPFTTPMTQTWQEQIDWIKQWIIDRFAWIDAQFLAAPVFDHSGGVVPGPVEVDITAEQGTVYYTLDGSDPRLSGGDVSPTALAITNPSQPILVDDSAQVTARAYDGSDWSAPVKASYLLNSPATAGSVAITELNYHPHDPTPEELAAGFATSGEFEFIELLNVDDEIIELQGITAIETIETVDGDEIAHPPAIGLQLGVETLAPGERGVIVSNPAAFAARYGEEIDGAPIKIIGQYTQNLDNDGEDVTLADRDGNVLLSFSFNDSGSWPGRADGKGASLELKDLSTIPDDIAEWSGHFSDGDTWRSSGTFGGTPSVAGVAAIQDIVINEVLANSDDVMLDTIELHNTTSEPVDVGGWYLSDSWGSGLANPDEGEPGGNYRKFRIPFGPESIIAAGGFLVFDETDFNPSGGVNPAANPNDFALSGSRGDDVWLMAADAQGKLTRFVDHVEFGATLLGESVGRFEAEPDAWEFVPLAERTFGAENANPRVGPLVISEIMYNPPGPSAGNQDPLEFIEIHNPTSRSVALDGWWIRGGIDFDFANGTTIGAHDTLVVLSFDPAVADNAALWTNFSTYYGLDTQTTDGFVGGYLGKLNNGGDTVRLRRADTPSPDDPLYVPHVLEDEVKYDNVAPWPFLADGFSHALQRLTPKVWGSSADSWTSTRPTPGTVTFTVSTAEVVGRHIFYNNSAFDGNGTEVGPADDGAIASDKTALLPGEQATAANYTNYARGINGLMIDLAGAADIASVAAIDNFSFAVGNDDNPSNWTPAATPESITVHQGGGVDGSDRIAITWADGAIAGTWLRVAMKATEATGLEEKDVFYFGNAIGESANTPSNAMVTVADELLARSSRHGLGNPAAIDDPVDFNRDRLVNAADRIIARSHRTDLATALKLITAPGVDALMAGATNAPAANLEWLADIPQPSVSQATAQSTSQDKRTDAVDRLLASFRQ